ncbi:MAG: hypothetical protein LBJ96_00135 [Holosporaceae bacterium]|nr:hypothetical protein [Holosporaceae bacterium]
MRIKEINDAMETLKYISADPETRAIADLRQKTINDRNSEMTVAVEEAEARGEAGGELKKAGETALNAINMGLTTEQIVKLSGLSTKEIELLKKTQC